MVAVAIVAILIGTGLEINRRLRRFARLAGHHSRVAIEQFGTFMAFGGDSAALDEVPPAGWGPARYLRRLKASIGHHHAMALKYESAARYPWLPVAPDPPEPE
jgi:hypothetical protein